MLDPDDNTINAQRHCEQSDNLWTVLHEQVLKQALRSIFPKEKDKNPVQLRRGLCKCSEQLSTIGWCDEDEGVNTLVLELHIRSEGSWKRRQQSIERERDFYLFPYKVNCVVIWGKQIGVVML